MKQWLQWAVAAVILVQIGCNPSKKITKAPDNITPKAQNTFQDIAQSTIFSDSNFTAAHVGISIYNPATQQYLYNYQGDKYFVPASNMKLFTCYAAMKNLGDSLVGLRYSEDKNGNLTIIGNGDPTFLHPNFTNQRVYEFLKNKNGITYLQGGRDFKPWGKGWAWDDYLSDYMPERSELPIYGNVAKFLLLGDTINVSPKKFYSIPLLLFNGSLKKNNLPYKFSFKIERTRDKNVFSAQESVSKFKLQYVPFTNEISFKQNRQYSSTITELLSDTLGKNVFTFNDVYGYRNLTSVIHSQPTDSLLKPMMHNSDNFFAEQTLLMLSKEKVDVMLDDMIIDDLLKSDFKGLPQKPRWVDGSGLSRYNLITPQDFVWVLSKMKADFPWQRITTILPTGNEGTLTNYYKNLSGNIFAKTGTLSGQVALSGYLLTKQGKTLVFSVLVNNHQTSASAIRRGVERFLSQVYEQY